MLYGQPSVHVKAEFTFSALFLFHSLGKKLRARFPSSGLKRLFILSEESATLTKHHKGVIEITEKEQGLKSLRSTVFRSMKIPAWPITRFGNGPVQL